MDPMPEFKPVFQNILKDLQENLEDEFDQMKLYKNIARLEMRTSKIIRKFDEKYNLEETLKNSLDKTIVRINQNQPPDIGQTLLSEESLNNLQRIVMDEHEIKELNNQILETIVDEKILDEEISDIDSVMEFCKNEPYLSQNEEKLKNLLDKCNPA